MFRQTVLMTATVALISGVQAVPVRAQSEIDLSTPEKAVRSFVAGFNNANMATVAKCVVGGQPGAPVLRELEKNIKSSNPTPEVVIVSLKVREGASDTKATVDVESELRTPGKPELTQKFTETLTLQKLGANWLVLSKDLNKGVSTQKDILGLLATMVAHPDALEGARDNARMTASLSNVKQLAIGVMMLVQDYDETFAIKPGYFRQSVMPYVKNEALFQSPLDSRGTVSYRFNDRLCGKSLATLKSPATTVMMYEGEYKKLKFRYQGRRWWALPMDMQKW